MSLVFARRSAARVACGLAALLASIALPSVARAAEASGDAGAAIQSVVMNDCELRQPNCVWNGSYISSVDALYAFASAKGQTSAFDAVLFRNDPTSSDWTVMIAATDTLRGCSEYTDLGIPDVVLDDLAIKGLKIGSQTPVDCGTPGPTPKDCKPFRYHRSIFDTSVLRTSCSKARAVVMNAATHPGKTPKGWVIMGTNGCNGYIVPKKYSGIQFPLAELPTNEPLIFLEIASGTCAYDETAPPADDAPGRVVDGIIEVPVGSAPTSSSSSASSGSAS